MTRVTTFAHRLITLYGGGPTWVSYLAGLNRNLWYRTLETAITVAGADNAAYTTPPGAEVIGDPEFNGTGSWWTLSATAPNTAAIASGKLTLHRETNIALALRDPFGNAGDTYRFLIQVDSTTGTLRLADTAGTPIYKALVVGVNDVTFIMNSEPDVMILQATNGDSVLDYCRGSIVGELDALIAATGVTVGQTGPLGANTAFDITTNGYLETRDPNNRINAKQTFEVVIPFKPENAGEGSAGHFMEWGNANGFWVRFEGAITALRASVPDSVSGAASTITDQGFTAAEWAVLFASFQSDKKMHLYKGTSSGVVELNATTQTALTNAVASQAGRALRLMNSGATNRAQEALVSNPSYGDVLTQSQRETITRLFLAA